jgi:hypothetical protein
VIRHQNGNDPELDQDRIGALGKAGAIVGAFGIGVIYLGAFLGHAARPVLNPESGHLRYPDYPLLVEGIGLVLGMVGAVMFQLGGGDIYKFRPPGE